MSTVFVNPWDDLQEVFDNLEPHSTVVMGRGLYKQKVVISVPYTTVEGNENVISFADYAKKLDENGVEYSTFKSYTLAVVADGVTLNNLVVENSAGKPAQLGQEVAVSVCASDFTANNCTFISTQDTLFCGPLPDDLVLRYEGFLPDELRYREGQTYQRYINCTIAGSVDYIFGCANALFENCRIVSVNDGREVGFIAAPAHSLACNCGFVFHKCKLLSHNAPATFLARPWRDFGKVTFVECSCEGHIVETGFDHWQGTARYRTARFAEYSTQEYDRVPWSKTLTKEQAEAFLDEVKSQFARH